MSEIGLTGQITKRKTSDSWSLEWGIHHGTVESRIHGETVTGLTSLEEARAKARDFQNRYATQRYFMWFATAVAPNGERHNLPEFATAV